MMFNCFIMVIFVCMTLPINIEDLIHGKTVEWERLEFKKGWNPEKVIHTICAFANDLNNWGGGYIIIGIDEFEGQPVLPPEGLHINQLDKIQGEVLTLAYQVLPNYFPIIQPYLLQGKHIIVIWCPAGDNRPYTAPIAQGIKAQRYPYIRFGSRSIIAKDGNLKRLQELGARIPFDDRVNGQAKISNLDLGLIQAYLYEVKSDLLVESRKISAEALGRQMHIFKGPDESLRPVNAGILFFCKEPEKFISRSWIELVWHKGFTGKNFTEKYFKGPVHYQLRAVLDFIQNNIIQEFVVKNPDKAEATRYYNYPFIALEEVLSNAVYHKSYELGSPIEVQIWPDKIEVLSYPGPVPPVDSQIIQQQKRIVAREYRNRRIGDFLKELKLTEGRGTGFPAIYHAMEQNDSPEPIFETDLACTYFLTILPAKLNDVQGIVAENEGANRNEGANVVVIEGANRNEGANVAVIEGANENEGANGLNAVLTAVFKEASANQRTKLEPLLANLIEEPGGKANDYANLTGLSLSTIERYIRQLKKVGLVCFSDKSTKIGGYFITEQFRNALLK